jgi:hypothetical protein
VPIAYIKVVPHPEIDPDYTIDDLVFDTPQPLELAPHAELFTLRLVNGDRLLAKGVTYADGAYHLQGVSAGFEKLDLPKEWSVRSLVPPLNGWKTTKLPEGCWLMLADGSILHAAVEDGPPICTHLPKLSLSAETICALWGDKGAFRELPIDSLVAERGKPFTGALYITQSSLTIFKTAVTFGKLFVTTHDLVVNADRSNTEIAKYGNAGTLWLAKPIPLPGAGTLRLLNGESFMLSPRAFTIDSLKESELILKRGDELVRLPAGEVLSLVPPKE